MALGKLSLDPHIPHSLSPKGGLYTLQMALSLSRAKGPSGILVGIHGDSMGIMTRGGPYWGLSI